MLGPGAGGHYLGTLTEVTWLGKQLRRETASNSPFVRMNFHVLLVLMSLLGGCRTLGGPKVFLSSVYSSGKN